MKKLKISAVSKFLPTLLLTLTFCNLPTTVTGDSATNLLELERVWQYLKVFSIHQDRVASEDSALKYSSPHDLAESVEDTIHSVASGYKDNFTVYYDDYKVLESIMGSNSSSEINIVENGAPASVAYSKLSDKTMYVYISEFQDQTDEDLQSLESYADQFENVIIDLRFNGGGYISTCTTMVDMFLPDSIYYMQTTYRKFPEKSLDTGTVSNFNWISGTRTSPFENRSVAFLINPLSASASEILVASVKDSKPGTVVVGENSFGKNIGQYVFYFDESSQGALKVTAFRFIRKDNSTYYETGIVPDIKVPCTNNFTDTSGAQLFAAAQALEPGFVQGSDFDSVKNFYNKLTGARGLRSKPKNYNPQCIMGEYHVGNNILK